MTDYEQMWDHLADKILDASMNGELEDADADDLWVGTGELPYWVPQDFVSFEGTPGEPIKGIQFRVKTNLKGGSKRPTKFLPAQVLKKMTKKELDAYHESKKAKGYNQVYLFHATFDKAPGPPGYVARTKSKKAQQCWPN